MRAIAGALGAADAIMAARRARPRNSRLTISGRADEKIHRPRKKLLHRPANATMCRSPNFARACGRVPVGGHPDKRPDSRPEQTPRAFSAA
jgi:hypothetical protein